MCHRKVISWDRECLRHHPPLSLNNNSVKKSQKEKVRNPIVHLVENILLVAAVKLLNGGEELIGGNPANHLVVQHNVKKKKKNNNKNNINITPPTTWQCNTMSTRRTTTSKSTTPQQTLNTFQGLHTSIKSSSGKSSKYVDSFLQF